GSAPVGSEGPKPRRHLGHCHLGSTGRSSWCPPLSCGHRLETLQRQLGRGLYHLERWSWYSRGDGPGCNCWANGGSSPSALCAAHLRCRHSSITASSSYRPVWKLV